ncbi:MAG: hypothetical protein E6I27_01340 [Chloroflexi bacterium]|nr:MAG: hypothetical protein E6I27_01340 [Chloroflexota bacterium]
MAGLTSTATVLCGEPEGTINDLKLWPMRLVIGRVVAALVLLAGAGDLLQAWAGGRDHYSIHRQVVQFGRSALELPILLYLSPSVLIREVQRPDHHSRATRGLLLGRDRAVIDCAYAGRSL